MQERLLLIASISTFCNFRVLRRFRRLLSRSSDLISWIFTHRRCLGPLRAVVPESSWSLMLFTTLSILLLSAVAGFSSPPAPSSFSRHNPSGELHAPELPGPSSTACRLPGSCDHDLRLSMMCNTLYTPS